MVVRSAVTVLLSAVLLLTGVGTPAATGEVVPPTVAERLEGLPTGEQPAGVQERLGAMRASAPEVAVRSSRVRTPIAFSMVGFEIPAGAEVGFRTSTDGQDWSAWEWAPALDPNDAPDEGTPEAAAAAPAGTRSEGVWVGEASWLQVRVLNGQPEDVGVDLIDSMGLSRSLPQRAADAVVSAWRAAPPPAAAAPGQPTIVRRAQWGADESLRKGSPSYAPVRMGVVHHTATSNSYSQSEAPGVVRGIYRYHAVNLGWSDIGYNLLIDRFGTVYEGRHGGLEAGVIGAHARNWNTGSFGVSVIGCFDSAACSDGGSDLPAASEAALIEVLAWKYDVHHVDVLGHAHMAQGERRTLVGHRDVGPSSCPGDRFYEELDGIRSHVAALQVAEGGVIVSPGVSPSTATIGESGLEEELTFSSRLREPGPWRLEVTDGDGAVVHTATGTGETAIERWSGRADLRAGAYTFEFSSDGRRTAEGGLRLARSCESAFCDVEGSVHAEAILRLHDQGVVEGCAERLYCPGGRVSRADMAGMTARALGLHPERTDHFVDVPPDHPQVEEISALYEAGIVRGDGERFYPDREVRRDQMATFIALGLGFTSDGGTHFSDVAGNVHESSINALADRGVTGGDGHGRYLPSHQIRRDQIASLLDRALQAR